MIKKYVCTIEMPKYSFKEAIGKIGRVIKSGRGADYYRRAKGLFNDVKNDYSNPSMGRRKRRSTPKMGRRRRRKH